MRPAEPVVSAYLLAPVGQGCGIGGGLRNRANYAANNCLSTYGNIPPCL